MAVGTDTQPTGSDWLSQLGDWGSGALKGLFSTTGDMIKGGLSNPALLPSLATAYQQWKQSKKYTDMAEKYAGQLDPFGGQRSKYQGKLAQMWDDPSSIFQDEGYNKFLNTRLENAARLSGAQGYSGSGKMMMDLADTERSLDWENLAKQRDQMALLAGANIGPQYAADMLKTGMLGSMGSENAALGALMYPFQQKDGGITINNQNGQNGGKGDPLEALKKIQLSDPKLWSEIQKAASQAGPGGIPGGIKGIFDWLARNPNVSGSTKSILEEIGFYDQGGLEGGLFSGSGQYSLEDLFSPGGPWKEFSFDDYDYGFTPSFWDDMYGLQDDVGFDTSDWSEADWDAFQEVFSFFD